MLVTFASDMSYTESGFLFGWTSTTAHESLLPGMCAWNCSTTKLGNGKCDPGTQATTRIASKAPTLVATRLAVELAFP